MIGYRKFLIDGEPRYLRFHRDRTNGWAEWIEVGNICSHRLPAGLSRGDSFRTNGRDYGVVT